ncbi:MAG: glycosyltransferase family 4 protein [Burkholderiales bacterium]|nr:glycosyltransferase family 4 protein [Burkholderiales bacterium]
MNIVLAVNGKFHHFDLARELYGHGALRAIFTSYPRFKLHDERIPDTLVHSYPYWHAPYMAFRHRHLLGTRLLWQWELSAKLRFDGYVARRLPDCDALVASSGSGLGSGKVAQQRGSRYVCDRGSAHIRVQDRILREEHDRWGVHFDGIDPRIIEREEEEYAQADAITVPSTFAMDSFLEQGVPATKLHKLPYGVDLYRFYPCALPAADRFDVLFIGGVNLQKGVPYLLEAFLQLRHPNKTLTLIGTVSPLFIAHLAKRRLWPDNVRATGHVSQDELKRWVSRSHVLVLPSVQDGFGLVVAQAMACGCPVVATTNTGAPDLFDDGVEGFIVPPRDSTALADRLQRLADDPDRRGGMAELALVRTRHIMGWSAYGRAALAVYRTLMGTPPARYLHRDTVAVSV